MRSSLKPIFFIVVMAVYSFCNPLYARDTKQDSTKNESQPYITRLEQYLERSDFDSILITTEDFFHEVDQHPKRFPADDWVDSLYLLIATKIYGKGKDDLLTIMLKPLLEIEVVILENPAYKNYGKLFAILAMSHKRMGGGV